MAHITSRFGFRHLRGVPTTHVRHHRRGQLAHDGVGLSFWYRPLTAVISEVPVDDRELPLLFHARTADFQDVAVQLTLTYRLADPALAAQRIDFAIDPDTGSWRGDPLGQLAGLLTENVQQYALAVLARTNLADALVDGVAAVRERVRAGLVEDDRMARNGTAVVDVRVVAVRAEPELEKALQTTARERVQQEADKATFERRALAVERERAISENELQSKIELARREEQLLVQRGANTRRQAEEAAAADEIETTARANREQRLTAAKAAGLRELGEAEAAKSRALGEAEAVKLRAVGEAEAARERAVADTAVTKARGLGEAEVVRTRALGEAEVAKTRGLSEVEVAKNRELMAANTAREAARLTAYRDLPEEVLRALNLRELALHLPAISQLTVTPDVVTDLLTRLGHAS